MVGESFLCFKVCLPIQTFCFDVAFVFDFGFNNECITGDRLILVEPEDITDFNVLPPFLFKITTVRTVNIDLSDVFLFILTVPVDLFDSILNHDGKHNDTQGNENSGFSSCN